MNQYLYGHITHARGCGGVPREASGRCCGAGYRACDITKLPLARHHNPPHKTRRICTNLEIVFFGPPGGTHTQPTPGGRSATYVWGLGPGQRDSGNWDCHWASMTKKDGESQGLRSGPPERVGHQEGCQTNQAIRSSCLSTRFMQRRAHNAPACNAPPWSTAVSWAG